jgi:hypothetical protein
MTTDELTLFIQKQIFSCQSAAALNNALLAKVFPSIDAPADVMATAGVTFCPGFLTILQSESPPSVEWFKNIRANNRLVWRVYLLVFEKEGCPALVYCGSATASDDGIRGRWTMYDRYSMSIRE